MRKITSIIRNQPFYKLIKDFESDLESSSCTAQEFQKSWIDILLSVHKTQISSMISSKLLCYAGRIASFLDSFNQENDFMVAYARFRFKESIDFCERLVEFATLCDLELRENEIAEFLFVLFSLSLSSKLIPEFKYWANLVFCRHFRLTELPVSNGSELGVHLVPRRIRVFLNRIRASDRYLKPYNVQLIYTAFQGLKKGFMPGGPDMIDASLLKHAKVLCEKDGTVGEDVVDVCERTANDIFGSEGIPSSFTNMNIFSRNSTLESGYSEAGMLGQLVRNVRCENMAVRSDFLVGMLENNVRVVEVRSCFYEYADLVSASRELVNDTFSENPCAQPYCIIEPMKIRIITKPGVYQHFGLKAVQKFLWKKLYNNSTGMFHLIGSTIDECQIARTLKSWKLGRKFCSGDYSAATDNLKAEVTKHIFQAVLANSDVFTGLWAWRSLMPSNLIYDRCHPSFGTKKHPHILDNWKYMYELIGRGEMKNGQLMGSILSFIILCVANLAAFRLAIERWLGHEVSLQFLADEFGVLVNGDDILFTAEEDLYWFWRSVIPEFGFEPSQGKNLFSDDIFQINSALFVPRYLVEKQDFYGYTTETYKCVSAEWVPYVNFGLITTRKKQDCSRDTRVWAAKWEGFTPDMLEGVNRLKVVRKVQSDLLEGLCPKLRRRTNKLFWEFSAYLKKAFPLIPFFELEEWGGIGLDSDGIDIDESNCIRQYVTGPVKDLLFKSDLPKGESLLREHYVSQFPEAVLLEDNYDPEQRYMDYVRRFRRIRLPAEKNDRFKADFTGIQLKVQTFPIV